MNKKLKVGQIGVGGFGAYRRARMRETGLFDLVAVFDKNLDTSQCAAAEEGATPCASYEELLNTPGLEAVVISTGAKFHAEQMLAAMEIGLHVFVEKPLCSTPQEMDALLAAQAESGVVVGVGHHDLWSERYARHIKQMIDGGELGSIVALEATTCHSGDFSLQPSDWRADPQKNPGGMLFQCGVHSLHEMMFYCGPIKSVSARMRYDIDSAIPTADAAICGLQFESGVIGSLHAYYHTPYRHTISIYGTRKNLYLNHFPSDGHPLYEQSVAPGHSGAVETPVPVDLPGADDVCGSLRSWHAAIRQGGIPYPSLEDGARVVSIVFAAEEADRNRSWVDIMGISKNLVS
jgi:predicted dehydrogenase